MLRSQPTGQCHCSKLDNPPFAMLGEPSGRQPTPRPQACKTAVASRKRASRLLARDDMAGHSDTTCVAWLGLPISSVPC